jgi:hypothetical protein
MTCLNITSSFLYVLLKVIYACSHETFWVAAVPLEEKEVVAMALFLLAMAGYP